MSKAGAATVEFSDEAWARRVGGVTSQHVGRLRRVYQRFGSTQARYEGLFWSHFQAALDWDDAEMWLEGAVQSQWSVATMRRTRAQTLGMVEADTSRTEESAVSDVDEDFVPEPMQEDAQDEILAGSVSGDRLSTPSDEAEEAETTPHSADDSDDDDNANPRRTIDVVQPLANLAELPPDFADAFDAMKLCILRHKSEGWQQISRDDTLAALDSLKELALAE
jgi:hypothetical protein